MNEKTLTQAVTNIVQELQAFSSEDRIRIVSATMALLGEPSMRPTPKPDRAEPLENQIEALPPKARSWLKQHGVAVEQVNQVFHFGDEGVEIIAPIPGANRKEQVRNAYVLCGIGQLLIKGETKFSDGLGRDICVYGGFFDSTNHSKYVKAVEFAGSRDKGWVLTVPGLKLGGSLVVEMSKV